ncbi:GntR family transcriptional regulator [Adhaeribacter aquaticus]|uniref:GntR family transcriptional regulator n=1 Tax=Adhaeribacter aquaticus TaxID=299567 RepID=UPI0003F81577|nr:GntR family transcriptional regulator [Adhaeribacter aquaticus]
MTHQEIRSLFQIDEYSATPKYLQITNSILRAIEVGKLQKNSVLPSINELNLELDVSRDTAVKSYLYLKKIGIISSVHGKGYFVKSTQMKQVLKIFLLFNKLSAHKKIIYDAFVTALGENVAIDFYIYNNNFNLFKKLILQKQEEYSHYVIIPHFTEGGENAHDIINTIPKEKLILLDKVMPGVAGEYGAVFENFSKDIYGALEQAKERLGQYHTLNIIVPENSYYPQDIVKGFIDFCQEYAFNYQVIHDISSEVIQEGNVYINLMEDDLTCLLEQIISLKLEVGKQVGVISYNETALKKFILNGITTISTDFKEMGLRAAELILNKSKEHIEVPFYLNLRKSL